MLPRRRRHPLRQKPQLPSLWGEVAGFKSERWPLSNRKRGRLQIRMAADLKSEKAPTSVGSSIWPIRPRMPTVWLCLSAIPTLTQSTATTSSVWPCATPACRGASAPLIGFGIPAAFAVGGILLGTKLLRRRRRSQR
jgi:hypothetical protein